jgi:indoleamine 2,3-dioxygenase
MTRCDLETFCLSPERGFLPLTDPLLVLPQAEFAAWEDLAKRLPKYLAGMSLRRMVQALPDFRTELLSNDAELKRAMVLLSFIGHAYVFGEQPIADRIPAVLAKPWFDVAKKLGRPPVLSYESFVLDNWQRIEPNGPIAIGNLVTLQNFNGGLDEEWVTIVLVDIEARAAQALNSIAAGRVAILSGDDAGLLAALQELSESLSGMFSSLIKINDFSEPSIYAQRVRPYLAGWKNNPALPNGLIYEGVPEFGGVGQSLLGDTGIHAGSILAIEGFLGISLRDEALAAHLLESRAYMSPQHRWFVEAAEGGPVTREYVALRPLVEGLGDAFSECVSSMERFRSKQQELLGPYIPSEAQESKAGVNRSDATVTPALMLAAR